MGRKRFALIVILLIIVGVLIVGGVIYYKTQKPSSIPSTASTFTPTEQTATRQGNATVNTAFPNALGQTKILYLSPSTTDMYLLTSTLSNPTKISNANNMTPAVFTNDGNKIVYVANNVTGISVYDIATKSVSVFHSDKDLSPRDLLFSPNGDYLYVEYGTDVLGSGTIYSYPQGTQVVPSFGELENKGWLDNTDLVVTDFTYGPTRGFVGSGESHEVLKIMLPSGRKQELLTPTDLNDYLLEDVENGVIYYSMETAKNVDDWNYDLTSPTTTYWKMDADGSAKTQIQQTDIPSYSLSKEIQDNLPTEYIEYSPMGATRNLANPQWVLFNLYKDENNGPSWLVAIMDLNNATSSFQVIGEGMYPMW